MAADSTDTLTPDTIIDKVVSLSDAKQSYALYLPPGYSKNKKYPILLAFDAGARGKLPVELFEEAARKYGYIVMGSHNSKNGPWQPIMEAIKALWDDAHNRFSIDMDRVYLAGFSGGARVCSSIAATKQKSVKGVILGGAAFSETVKDDQVEHTFFIGTIGSDDFNYREIQALEKRLKPKKNSVALMYYDGYHSWPSKEDCTRAIEWFEVRAMAEKLKANDKQFIEYVFNKEKKIAEKYKFEGNSLWSVYTYEQMFEIFKDLMPMYEIMATVREIKDSSEYHKLFSKDEKMLERENRIIKMTGGIYGAILHNPVNKLSYTKLVGGIEMNVLKKDATKEDDFIVSRSAIRTLVRLQQDLDWCGQQLLDKKEYEKASLIFRLSSETLEYASPWAKLQTHYSLACTYAAMDDQEKSFEELESLKDIGFFNPVNLQNEFFNKMRDSEQFKTLEQKITETYKAYKAGQQ
ncbi:MAG: hypothetical protein JW737_00540 [Acidobacteria bacterium]|nr:hypothetical protein [Acidobacteriota bacterium]